MVRPLLPLCAGILVASCARPAVRAAPDLIERAEVLPEGFESLGTARADCRKREGFSRAAGEKLASFDCTSERLDRMLAEQASEAGAELLAGRRCAKRGRQLSCSAVMGRDEREVRRALSSEELVSVPAPGPVAVRRWDEPRASAALVIEVDFQPSVEDHGGRRRPAEAVNEHAWLPVSHRDLGTLTTRCAEDECGFKELHHGLRVAAGGLGASDLVAVRCFTRDAERECVATLAATEVDPERDPRAR